MRLWREGEETFLEHVRFVREEIVDKWVTFTKIHRAEDPEMVDAVIRASRGEYVDLPEVWEPTIGDKPSVICWSHDRRKAINWAMGIFRGECLPPFEVNKYSREKLQSFVFKVGMPVLCIENEPKSRRKKEEDRPPRYCNNDWGVIRGFVKDKKVIVVVEGAEQEFTVAEFHYNFAPGFALTVHSVHGSTMDWDFCIAEYDKMDWRLRYTALSRARRFSQVKKMFEG